MKHELISVFHMFILTYMNKLQEKIEILKLFIDVHVYR